MKFIFSFLFAFIFISPVIAAYNPGTSTETCRSQSSDTCNSTPGCVWVADECSRCDTGYACSNGQETECPSGFDSNWANQNKAHPDGASSCSDWKCIDGFFPIDTDNDDIPDECSLCNPENTPEHAEFYNDDCDWRCIQGYYEDNNSCIQCPTGSNTTASGATDISQCNCPQGQYLINTNGTYSCGTCTGSFEYDSDNMSCKCNINGANSNCECANHSNYNENNNKCECTTAPHLNATYDDDGVLTCSSCADNAAYDVDDNECKCNAGYYGNGDTNCEKCPSNSTTNGAGSTSISACKCNIGYYDTESDANSVSCSACPSNSTTDDAGSTSISACKCNIGYYDAESDAESVSCQKCPIGMTTVTLVNGNPTNTTTNGATSIEHCAMLATSKFCFTNPNSTNRQLICTPLIPSSATKINDRTISATTNSGN